MNETCCDNDSSAKLFDDGKHDARAVHLEHLLQNQGRIHSYSLLVLVEATTLNNSHRVRSQTTLGR